MAIGEEYITIVGNFAIKMVCKYKKAEARCAFALRLRSV